MNGRKIRIDNIFEAIERMIEDLQNDVEHSFKELQNNSILESRPLMYGFTMSIGPDGEPVVRTFGDKQITTGCREPVYEQFVKNDTDELIVMIEMPGISRDEIQLNVSHSKLIVTTTPKAERRYKADIELKAQADPKSAKATYRNGILSVTLRVKGNSNKGIKISVE
ncbi:MAG: Hsp20/alpha crystallin family protein [Nitrososphaerales archaeon]